VIFERDRGDISPRLRCSDSRACNTACVTDDTATAQLAALAERREHALAEASAIEAKGRAAHQAAVHASREFEQIERTRIAGTEKVTSAAVRAAEETLAAARATASEPWNERARAAKMGADDLLHQMQRFAAEHLDELLEGLREKGEAAARTVDAGAEMILDGYAARAAAEREVFALISMIRATKPGDVERTKAEQLAGEAQKLLREGGEVAPVVLHDPRKPRHAVVAAEPATAA
jgi:vacuolar-type H+-ATPase subunit H